MGRELPDYRSVLEDILASNSGRRVLTTSEVVRYTNRSRAWVEKNLMPSGETEILAHALARRMCARYGGTEARR